MIKWDLTSFIKAVKTSVKTVNKQTPKTLDEIGKEVMKKAKAGTPVRSGRLKGGWFLQKNRKDLFIINKVPYASYVEDGTSKMRPRHMLRNALSRVNGDKSLNKLGNKIKKLWQ